jgi:hypothetical protein
LFANANSIPWPLDIAKQAATIHWVERGRKYADHAFDAARLAEVKKQQELQRVGAAVAAAN